MLRSFPLAFSLLVVTGATSAPAPAAQDPSEVEPVATVDGVRFRSWSAYTSSPLFRERGLRCGRGDARVTQVGPLPVMQSDCAFSSTNPTTAYAPTYVMDVPVVFHVIQRTNGTGFVSQARIQEQVAILNEDFRALAGTPGSPGVDTMIQFHLATTDPNGNATTGITYSTNNTWYDDGGGYWNSLAWDPDEYLNVYTNSAGGYLGYVPNIPQGGIVGLDSDRVVVLHSSVGRNAPIGPPYDQGRTLTHEIGHYLGLEHTFYGGCGGGNCYTSGDYVCDTNPQANDTFGCPSNPTSCGSLDPWHNYMDYTNDVCMWEFTQEQARRMRCTLEFWRPQLADVGGSGCLAAGVTPRNSGGNPVTYTATPPVLGTTMTAVTSPILTGHDFAVVFGSLGQTDVGLGAGQRLLVNLFPPFGDLFSVAPLPGPTASFPLTIPNDQSLCGLDVFTQAAHFGGAATFALTNAQDLRLGN